jgi:O-antigen ligase
VSEVLQPFTTTLEELAGASTPATVVSTSALARVLDATIFYSLLVVISLTAIPYGTVEPWWRAVFEGAVFVLGLMWVIHGLLSGTWFVPQHRLLIPLLALAIFALFQMMLPLRAGSLRLSFSPYDTRTFVYALLALIVVAGLLLRYTTNRRRLMAMVYIVIGVGLVSTLFGFARMAFQHKTGFLLPDLQPNDGTVTRGVGFAQFINHNHFAFLAEMSLGLVLGLMLRRPMRLARLAIGLAIAIPMWIAIVYSGSRGGLVSMLGQVMFVALLVFIAGPGRQLLKDDVGPERERRIAPFLVTRIVLIASFLVLMVVGILWVGGDPLALHLESVPNEFGVQDTDKYTRTHRSTIWPMTWQMIKDHPVVGTGFGAYWIAITKYHRGSGEMTPQQAHNDYLDLLAGGGFIGLALVIWFVGNCARDLSKRLRTSDPALRAPCFGALAGILAVAVHSVVDFGLHITVNALVFIMLIVIATVSPAFITKAENVTSPLDGAKHFTS